MKYIATDLGTGPYEPETKGQKIVRRILSAVLPQANPDFEERFDEVRTWWVEIDDTSGLPEREIGFDVRGEPIVVAPFQDNLGFWTDSNMTFDSNEHETIESMMFEESWRRFEQDWTSRERESTA